MKTSDTATPSLHDEWENEFREYFDKALKPKKPTMKNLDRELCIDFIRNLIKARESAQLREVMKWVEGQKKQNWEGPFGSDHENYEHKRMKGYNQAVVDVLAHLQALLNEKA